jgi:Protein of unknown function DUF262
MAKKVTQEQIDRIDAQIRQESFPYNYDTKEYPVEVLVSKYAKDELFVPHYQRQFVWDPKQKSRFIESVFLGVPIMPLFVSVSGEDSVFEIIDGSQRIRTLVEYVVDGKDENGKQRVGMKLQGLTKLTELNGTVFSQLPTGLRNKFRYRDFRFHVVTDNATNEIRADVFDRVNTSAKLLTASEVRKGAFQSKFYDFILECSKLEQFRKLCPIPKAKASRGEYEELVLRFFAYSESYQDFKHDVAPFLDEYVKSKATAFNREEQKKELTDVLDFVETYFPEPYFSRKGRDNATPRVRFEAISVGVHLAIQIEPQLKPTYMEWLDSSEFKEITTSDASNNQGKLVKRVEFVRDCLLNRIKKDQLSYD